MTTHEFRALKALDEAVKANGNGGVRSRDIDVGTAAANRALPSTLSRLATRGLVRKIKPRNSRSHIWLPNARGQRILSA